MSTRGESETLAAAREYVREGWAVIPIPKGTKRPLNNDWKEMRLAEKDLPRHFSNGANIGVLCGVPSSGRVDVDLDVQEALAVADMFLPPTHLVHGRASKLRSHRWYRCFGIKTRLEFRSLKGQMLVELRGSDGEKGFQTVVPPSFHPSGERIEWSEHGEPSEVDAVTLSNAVRSIASAALLAMHWPARGSRHLASLALAGVLARANWGEDETSRFVVAVAEAAQDEEANARKSDVRTTYENLRAQRQITGAPELAKHVGEKVVAMARDWLQITNATVTADWPDPSPLGDELPPVLAFTPELLPKSLLPLVEDISERMQTPMDYAAAAAIVALASCVNRRATMQPKAKDVSWQVISNLWGAIIAPPGMMKSPVLRAVTQPLARIEESWRIEYESAVENFKGEKECADLRYQAWKEDYKRAVKNREVPPVQPDKSLPLPTQRRLILTDATFEKLHEILAENPAGVLVLRDELTGWLATLDKQGREGERAFYLQAWNGDAGFGVDRIGRGSIYVPHVCVSLLGNIQPARLRWYLSDAVAGGPNDDGLFQRFQILVWPNQPPDWKLIDRKPNDHALAMVERVFSVLANLSADSPVRMCFDIDSQELFFVWLTELERKLRGDFGEHPAMIAHLSKYRSLMPSLAALFELADRAAAHGKVAQQITVSVEHAKQAAALCEYLESHARRVYACIVSPECRAARELARHIQAGDLSNPFKTRDVYLKGWTGLNDSGRVRSAIELLEEAAWVRREESPNSQSGGRPSESWRISPKVVRREK